MALASRPMPSRTSTAGGTPRTRPRMAAVSAKSSEHVADRIGQRDDRGDRVTSRGGHDGSHDEPPDGRGAAGADDAEVEDDGAVRAVLRPRQGQQPEDEQRVEGKVAEVRDGRCRHLLSLDRIDQEPGEVAEGVGDEGGREEPPGPTQGGMARGPCRPGGDGHDKDAERHEDAVSDGTWRSSPPQPRTSQER